MIYGINTTVPFKKLHEAAVLPQRAKDGDAGLDLYSIEETVVFPGTTVRIRTGLACAIPQGFVGHIHARSSMFYKGLDLDGVIDAGYRGEILLQVCNQGNEQVKIPAYTRVAQMIVYPIWTGSADFVEELPSSERGESGFGSSGT